LFRGSNLLSRDLLAYDSNDLGSNSMKKLRILGSLVSNENDYQREQARAVIRQGESRVIKAVGGSTSTVSGLAGLSETS